MSKKKIRINNLSPDSNGTCLNLSLFFRYLEGTLNPRQIRDIEAHLNVCPSCFREMVSIVRDSFVPITKDEQIALSNITKLTATEQISRILAYQKQEIDSIDAPKQKPFFTPESVRNSVLKKFGSGFIRYRPALAVLSLVLLAVVLFYGTTYFRIEYPIRRAERLLKNNYRIYIENTRLSGGYLSTGVSMLMSSREKPPSYLETAKNNLLQAVRHGTKSSTATRLLAQIYLIERNFPKADSLFNLISDESEYISSAYNDLGVFFAEQKEWQKAAVQFQSALNVEAPLLEAYYNLALMKMELGSKDEAVSLLTTYIDLERDDVWRDAAQHLIKKWEHIENPA